MRESLRVTLEFINLLALVVPNPYIPGSLLVLTAEIFAHPGLRQHIFKKDEFRHLNVPKVGTYTVHDVFDCTFECLSIPSCLSFNMAAAEGADGKLWCELLSADKFSIPKEYKGNQSSHHFFTEVG